MGDLGVGGRVGTVRRAPAMIPTAGGATTKFRGTRIPGAGTVGARRGGWYDRYTARGRRRDSTRLRTAANPAFPTDGCRTEGDERALGPHGERLPGDGLGLVGA